MAGALVSPHPFTTIKPNEGVGYVKVKCPKPNCNPVHGYCVNSNRFVPIKLLDVAGLVTGASKGRGLGNQFMNDLSTADAFIITVDASGGTDSEGNPAVNYNPVDTVKMILNEIDEWFAEVIKRQWEAVKKRTDGQTQKLLAEKLAGLGIREDHIKQSINYINDIELFARKLRELSKPYLIAANKIDLSNSAVNIERLKKEFKAIVKPVSALMELTLREADKKGFISYAPGEGDFKVLKDLSGEQSKGLDLIKSFLNNNKTTGVQDCINSAVFELLKMKVSYPVQDDNKWADSKGNVLPDALLLEGNATALDLAYKVHTSIGDGFIRAIDARTKKIIGKEQVLKDSDIIKIVSKA